VRTVCVDFTKVFDCVDHSILVAKMRVLDLPDVIICWMCSFHRHRRQQLVIGDVMSDWVQMVAGMPPGSYLIPLAVVILIDALHPICMTHKFIDDITMTQILNRSDISCMQLFIDELVHQSSEIGTLIMAHINTLEERRELLTKRFFRRAVMRESSCLHYLLPDKQDSDILNKLRCPKIFQPLTVNTEI